MNAQNTKNPLNRQGSIIFIVLAVVAGVLALVSWLTFGNIHLLGIYVGVFIAVMAWSLYTGLLIGRQQRKWLWLAGVFILLGATVVGLKVFDFMSYFLSITYAVPAYLCVIAGTVLRTITRHPTKEDD
ncbi:MAG: hypothetical protein F4X56_05065 [Gammaproteobacteria bacterium]|nr:hypothetical protein [Gammaproteobacteria bacterium]